MGWWGSEIPQFFIVENSKQSTSSTKIFAANVIFYKIGNKYV